MNSHFYHIGHLMGTSFEYSTNNQLNVMGESYGYQHLWQEGQANLDSSPAKTTWFNDSHFFSLTSSTNPGDQIIFGRIGANDPNFNLRRRPCFNS